LNVGSDLPKHSTRISLPAVSWRRVDYPVGAGVELTLDGWTLDEARWARFTHPEVAPLPADSGMCWAARFGAPLREVDR
jgi:hypothetical protein